MKLRHLAMVMTAFSTALFGATGLAHVTANPDEGVAGSYFRTALRVSHGCSGSPTVALRVQIPEALGQVKPEAKADWSIAIATREPEQPESSREPSSSRGGREIVWHGGRLSDAHFEEFGLSMKLPDAAGRTFYLPVVQECAEGANEWTSIPDSPDQWHAIERPAPFIRVIQGEEHH